MLSRGLFGVLFLAVAVGSACDSSGESNGMEDTGHMISKDAQEDSQTDGRSGDDMLLTDTSTLDTSSPDTSSPDARTDAATADTSEVDTVDTPFAAFPEAEGFGSVAIGGRSGAVIQVTNLNDSGPDDRRAHRAGRGHLASQQRRARHKFARCDHA